MPISIKVFKISLMTKSGVFTINVNEIDNGERFDIVVSSYFPECNRNLAKKLIQNGDIKINGFIKKPGYNVRCGDIISGEMPSPKPISAKPEKININIIYEDDYIIVVNKQANLVIHPAKGNYTGTLVNALLYHCPYLNGIGGELRPGIVHRLDKDTTGVMVIAKNQIAHHKLSHNFKNREIKKKYIAIIHGEPSQKSGTVSFPIGRHPKDRKKMSIKSRHARPAETCWKVKERFDGATMLDIEIHTGRTHQIRVHCAAMNFPIIGDPVYGIRNKKNNRFISDEMVPVSRQMLHSRYLEFPHPESDEIINFKAVLPEDMKHLIKNLRSSKK